MFDSKLNKTAFIYICLLFFESRQIKAQSTAICQGDSAVLRMNCSYLGGLQWQYSATQVSWTDINGAVLDTMKVKPAATTYYRAVITNGNCRLVYSDTAVITVNTIPPAPSISTVNNCGTSILTASGFTGTLLWSTGQTVNPITVNSAGTYSLTQTVNGCISAAGSAAANPIIVPQASTAGTNIPSAIQIVWNWNAAAGASGYKYNTVNNYSTSTDNLGSHTYTQTGLTCNAAYPLYVWAYNSCGNSSAAILAQTTTTCYTYSWYQSGWSACSTSGSWNVSYTTGCSVPCGGGTQMVVYACSPSTGTQSQTVYCLRSDGQPVADSYCSGSKPASSQSCASSSCPGADPSYSQSCNNQACDPCQGGNCDPSCKYSCDFSVCPSTNNTSLKWGPQTNTPFNAGESYTNYSWGGSMYCWTTKYGCTIVCP